MNKIIHQTQIFLSCRWNAPCPFAKPFRQDSNRIAPIPRVAVPVTPCCTLSKAGRRVSESRAPQKKPNEFPLSAALEAE